MTDVDFDDCIRNCRQRAQSIGQIGITGTPNTPIGNSAHLWKALKYFSDVPDAPEASTVRLSFCFS